MAVSEHFLYEELGDYDYSTKLPVWWRKLNVLHYN